MPTTAYFVLPLASTIATIGNELAIAPAANSLNDEVDMVWRTSSLTNTYIIYDLGAALDVNTVAVLFNNLRSSDTVRVRCGTSAANTSASPTFDSNATGGNFVGYTGAKNADAKTKTLCQLPATYNARYWRVDIIATGHPDGYVQASRIMFGLATVPGMECDLNATRFFDENSVVYTGPGYTDVDEYQPNPGWKMGFSNLDGTIWRDTFFPFLMKVGINKKCVLFVMQPGLPASWQNEMMYGRFKDRIEGEQRAYNGWWLEMSITSIGL